MVKQENGNTIIKAMMSQFVIQAAAVDTQVLTWIGGAFLAVIGFLASFLLVRAINTLDSLTKEVTSLRISVAKLDSTFNNLEEKEQMRSDSCNERHDIINTRLAKHSEQIAQLTTRPKARTK